jgi:peptidoglycan/LPS O-acetylase OafA/YrhL
MTVGRLALRSEQTPSPVHRLLWLDTMRGLAILGIMIYHAALVLFGIPPFDHPKDDWLPLADRLDQLRPVQHWSLVGQVFLNVSRGVGWLGYQGVHLFLVLSGFGLTWSQARHPLGGPVSLRQYYWTRLRRIYPLYWAGHLFFLLAHMALGRLGLQLELIPPDGRFWLSLLGVRSLPDTFFYISPAWWYVGLMLQLYLVYPLLWAWLRHVGVARFWFGTAAVTLGSRSLLLHVVGHHREMWSMGALFTTRLFEFAFGMGVAHWLARQPDGLERLRAKPWLLLIAASAYLTSIGLSFTVSGSVLAHSLIAVSLFWMSYVLSHQVVAKARRVALAIGWVGRQSYSLMILHQPLLRWFIPWMMPRVPYLVFFALLALFILLAPLGSALFGWVVVGIVSWLARALAAVWALVPERRALAPKEHVEP